MTLDLGPWGAVQTQGWERTLLSSGLDTKLLKHFINSKLIYPPRADRSIAFEAANPVVDIARLKELAQG
jgi:NADH dehydrogenase